MPLDGVAFSWLDWLQWGHIKFSIELSLVLICCRCTCDMAASTPWDTVQIWEQKWPATLLIPVFTPGIPAKLTQVQLCRHAGGRALRWLQLPAAHVLIHPRRVPGCTSGYVADTSAAYENQALYMYPGWVAHVPQKQHTEQWDKGGKLVKGMDNGANWIFT